MAFEDLDAAFGIAPQPVAPLPLQPALSDLDAVVEGHFAERKPWGLMDDVRNLARSSVEAVGNSIGFLAPHIITDTEMAPAPGAWASTANMISGLASGLQEGAVGAGLGTVAAPGVGTLAGLGAAGAVGQLARNAEEHRIRTLREQEAANANSVALPKPLIYDHTDAGVGYSQLDNGDYADAGFAGLVNLLGGKAGQMVMKGTTDNVVQSLLSSGNLPTGEITKAAVKMGLIDAGLGGASGVSGVFNRENVDPASLLDGQTYRDLLTMDNLKAVGAEALLSGAVSAGGQAVSARGDIQNARRVAQDITDVRDAEKNSPVYSMEDLLREQDEAAGITEPVDGPKPTFEKADGGVVKLPTVADLQGEVARTVEPNQPTAIAVGGEGDSVPLPPKPKVEKKPKPMFRRIEDEVNAYDEYRDSEMESGRDPIEFEDWRSAMRGDAPKPEPVIAKPVIPETPKIPTVKDSLPVQPAPRSSDTEVVLDNGDKYPARYVIREMKDIRPSNRASTGFQETEGYPMSDYQMRKMDGDAAAEAYTTAQKRAQEFDPAQWVNTSKSVERTMPVLDSDGNVMVGNNRVGALELTQLNYPERAAAFQAEQRAKASEFGLSPEDFDKYENPVIVREFAGKARSPEAIKLAQSSNVRGTKGMGSREQAESVHRVLSQDKRFYDDLLTEFDSGDKPISEVLKGGAINGKFIRGLQKDFAGELPQWIEDGKLNNQGREILKRTLFHEAFKGDPDGPALARFISSEEPNTLQRMEHALPQIVRINADKDLDPEWRLTKEFGEVARFLRETGEQRTGEKKVSIESLLSQSDVFSGDVMRPSPKAELLLRALDGNAYKLRETLRQYHSEARSDGFDLMAASGVEKNPESVLRNLVGDKTRKSKEVADDPAPMRSAVSKLEAVDNAPSPARTLDQTTKELQGAANLTKHQTRATSALISAHAKTLGMTGDEYVNKYIKGVEKGGKPAEGALKQADNIYHGTPHDFDKFSNEAIGTGEGAQAFGQGLYFTEKEAVARGYAKNVAKRLNPSARVNNDIDILSRMLDDPNKLVEYTKTGGNAPAFAQNIARDIIGETSHTDAVKSHPVYVKANALSSVLDTHHIWNDKPEASAADIAKAAADLTSEIHKYKREVGPEKRVLYNNTLFKGKKQGEDYEVLEWEKPVPEHLHDKILNALPPESDQPQSRDTSDWDEADWDEAASDFRENGGASERVLLKRALENDADYESVYTHLAGVLDSETKASQLMASIGVPAHKFRGVEGQGDYYNYVVYDDKEITVERKEYFQKQKGAKAKGSVEFDADEKAIIRAFEGADISTVVHELGHIFRRSLPEDLLKGAETWAGVENGKWTIPAEEKFARGFERYLADGSAPTPMLQQVFAKLKTWLSDIYKTLKGSEIDVKIGPEMRAVYDAMLGGKTKPDPITASKPAAMQATAQSNNPPKKKLSMSDEEKAAAAKKLAEYEAREAAEKQAAETEDAEAPTIKASKLDEEEVALETRPFKSREEEDSVLETFAADKDTESLERITVAYQKKLRQVAGRYVTDAAAKDVVQDVFTDLLAKGLKGFDPSAGSFNKWIQTKAKNKAKDYAKSPKNRNNSLDEPVDDDESLGSAADYIEATEANPRDALFRKERARAISGLVNAILDHVEPKYQRAMRLRIEYQMSNPEIAKELNLKEKTVAEYVSKGLAQAKEHAKSMGNVDVSVFQARQGQTAQSLLRFKNGKASTEPLMNLYDLSKKLSKALDNPVMFGRTKGGKGAAGTYTAGRNVTYTAKPGDFETYAHEAGHRLDDMFDFSKNETLSAEMLRLGDDQRPGSRSSWNEKKPLTNRLREGAGEFMRYYLMDPVDARRMAPKTYATIEGHLAKNNPNVLRELQDVQRRVDAYLAGKPAERLDSMIVSKHTERGEPLTLQEFKNTIIDSGDIMKRLQFFRDQQGGGKVKDLYHLYSSLRRAGSQAEEFYKHGAFKFDGEREHTGTRGLEPMLKDAQNAGVLNDLRRYMLWKNAEDMHKPPKGKDGKPLTDDDGNPLKGKESGFTDEDIKNGLLALEGHKKIKQIKALAKEIGQWQDDVLDFVTDAGLVSKDTAAVMRELNKNYVPMSRFYEAALGEDSVDVPRDRAGNPLKRRTGSLRPIYDPFETMVENLNMLVSAANRNELMLEATVKTVDMDNSGQWVSPFDVPMQRHEATLRDMKKKLKDNGIDVTGIKSEVLDEAVGIFRANTKTPYGKNVVQVMVEGKPKFFKIQKDVYEALQGMEPIEAGLMMRQLIGLGNVLRAGVTQNPGYAVFNAARDTQSRAINTNKKGTGASALVDGIHRGMTELLAQTISRMGKPNSEAEIIKWAEEVIAERKGVRSEMRRSKAPIFTEMRIPDRSRARLSMHLRDLDTLTPRERAMAMFWNGIDAYKQVLATFENLNREAEYVSMRNEKLLEGGDAVQAMDFGAGESANLMDFGKKGSSKGMRQFAAMSPFLYANIQGLVRMGESFGKDRTRTMVRMVAYTAVPTIINYLLNESNPEYHKLPQWEKDKYWHIYIGDGEFIRFPRTHDFNGIIGIPMQRVMQKLRVDDPEAFDNLADEMGKSLVGMPSMPALRVPLENAVNHSFFQNGPLANASLMRELPKNRFNTQTSLTARALGSLSNTAPVKWENAIRGFGGSLGATFTHEVADKFVGVATGWERTSSTKAPLSEITTHRLGDSSEAVSRLYKKVESERTKHLEEEDRLGYDLENPPELKELEGAIRLISLYRKQASTEKDEALKKHYIEQMESVAATFVKLGNVEVSEPKTSVQIKTETKYLTEKQKADKARKEQEARFGYSRNH